MIWNCLVLLISRLYASVVWLHEYDPYVAARFFELLQTYWYTPRLGYMRRTKVFMWKLKTLVFDRRDILVFVLSTSHQRQ